MRLLELKFHISAQHCQLNFGNLGTSVLANDHLNFISAFKQKSFWHVSLALGACDKEEMDAKQVCVWLLVQWLSLGAAEQLQDTARCNLSTYYLLIIPTVCHLISPFDTVRTQTFKQLPYAFLVYPPPHRHTVGETDLLNYTCGAAGPVFCQREAVNAKLYNNFHYV